jgi:threonine dehydrogenase-like Zn-dependent dehydrogenase
LTVALVLEATGDSQVMLDALSLLSRSGVACLLGIDGRPRRVSADGQVIGVDMVLQNHVLFGSINARREDWITATHDLMAARRRWPDAVESFVGLTVDPDAFAYRGVKATLAFGTM